MLWMLDAEECGRCVRGHCHAHEIVLLRALHSYVESHTDLRYARPYGDLEVERAPCDVELEPLWIFHQNR